MESVLFTDAALIFGLAHSRLFFLIIIFLTERQETIKLSRRKVFCQITQHLLENHDMWRRVLASEVQEEDQKEEQNYIGSPADPITAIHEEEEEEEEEQQQQANKEEDSADGLDEGEMMPAVEEEEGLSQTDATGENEA